ncbi:MAG: hypothetical protein ACJAZP_000241 [Psychromonas sp.]|jgi:hypothetical protein
MISLTQFLNTFIDTVIDVIPIATIIFVFLIFDGMILS